jgi:hypothetical protein
MTGELNGFPEEKNKGVDETPFVFSSRLPTSHRSLPDHGFLRGIHRGTFCL